MIINANFDATAPATFSDTVTIDDTATLNGALDVSGLTTVSGLNVTGNLAHTGNHEVTGNITATGVVTGGSFVGDGAGLTNLPIPASTTFKGSIDVTATAPTGVNGDVYSNTVAGTADASFTGIAGQSVAVNQLIFYAANAWQMGAVEDTSSLVTLNTTQTLTGAKTFEGNTTFKQIDGVSSGRIYMVDSNGVTNTTLFPGGNASFGGNLTSHNITGAGTIIVTGATGNKIKVTNTTSGVDTLLVNYEGNITTTGTITATGALTAGSITTAGNLNVNGTGTSTIKGNRVVLGGNTVSGDVVVRMSSLEPWDALVTLGGSGAGSRWKEFYTKKGDFSSTVTFGGNIIGNLKPNANNIQTLGGSTQTWSAGYVNRLVFASGAAELNTDGSISLTNMVSLPSNPVIGQMAMKAGVLYFRSTDGWYAVSGTRV